MYIDMDGHIKNKSRFLGIEVLFLPKSQKKFKHLIKGFRGHRVVFISFYCCYTSNKTAVYLIIQIKRYAVISYDGAKATSCGEGSLIFTQSRWRRKIAANYRFSFLIFFKN